jgi:hypothetical protein
MCGYLIESRMFRDYSVPMAKDAGYIALLAKISQIKDAAERGILIKQARDGTLGKHIAWIAKVKRESEKPRCTFCGEEVYLATNGWMHKSPWDSQGRLYKSYRDSRPIIPDGVSKEEWENSKRWEDAMSLAREEMKIKMPRKKDGVLVGKQSLRIPEFEEHIRRYCRCGKTLDDERFIKCDCEK